MRLCWKIEMWLKSRYGTGCSGWEGGLGCDLLDDFVLEDCEVDEKKIWDWL